MESRIGGCATACSGTFNEIYVLNLHGSAKKKEAHPTARRTRAYSTLPSARAIALFVKATGQKVVAFSMRIYGANARSKYAALLETSVAETPWRELKPKEPHFFLVPKEFSARKSEYKAGCSIAEIFSVWQNGLKTDRDELFFDFSAMRWRSA